MTIELFNYCYNRFLLKLSKNISITHSQYNKKQKVTKKKECYNRVGIVRDRQQFTLRLRYYLTTKDYDLEFI